MSISHGASLDELDELIGRAVALLDDAPPIQTVDYIRRRDRELRGLLGEWIRRRNEPRLF